jgi:hypothetical protein
MSWFRSVVSWLRGSPPAATPGRTVQPVLEGLEDRWVPSTKRDSGRFLLTMRLYGPRVARSRGVRHNTSRRFSNQGMR